MLPELEVEFVLDLEFGYELGIPIPAVGVVYSPMAAQARPVARSVATTGTPGVSPAAAARPVVRGIRA